jgi:hypothetical protein
MVKANWWRERPSFIPIRNESIVHQMWVILRNRADIMSLDLEKLIISLPLSHNSI